MYAHCNVVKLDSEASQFIEGMVKSKNVGKPILPCTFGGSSYYGLCDIGTAVNVIPYRFYFSIQDELKQAKLEDTDMTIMLADKTLRVPMGIIRNVPISIGPYKYPIDFIVIDMPIDSHFPIIFGRTFLNTAGAKIDCRKETISLKFGEEVMNFHFSKFDHKPIIEDFEEELEEEGNLTNLSIIIYDIPEADLEISLLENDSTMKDLDEEDIDEYLDSSLVVNSSMNKNYETPERKGDKALPPPELKHLPPDLKYRFLDETNKYHVIISANLAEKKRNN